MKETAAKFLTWLRPQMKIRGLFIFQVIVVAIFFWGVCKLLAYSIISAGEQINVRERYISRVLDVKYYEYNRCSIRFLNKNDEVELIPLDTENVRIKINPNKPSFAIIRENGTSEVNIRKVEQLK